MTKSRMWLLLYVSVGFGNVYVCSHILTYLFALLCTLLRLTDILIFAAISLSDLWCVEVTVKYEHICQMQLHSLPRNALQCKAWSCYHTSSVRPSVRL